MSDLLAVDDALIRIFNRIAVLAAEDIATVESLGRILSGDIVAAINIPSFANSSMDGYAVRAADVAGAAFDSPVELTVIGEVLAGTTPEHTVGPSQALRIMTGALLPNGANAVIPVELTDATWQSDGRAPLSSHVIVFGSVQPGDNVRPVGENMRAGQTVLRTGTRLRPQDIGVLASLGESRISVIRQPRVAIISTGNELVDIDEPIRPGQIRNSNGYILAGLVSSYGGIPIRLPVARDTLDDVRRCFQDALAQEPDLIVSSAGVSVGTHDVVRTAIEEMGALELWRINLRPGKPLAFGHVDGVPFFGLPGNPVSVMVTFDVFMRPALLKQGGDDPHNVPMITAVLGETMQVDGRRTYVRVTLTERGRETIAHPTGTQSSGALFSMVLADGLLIIPEGITEAKAGSRFPVRLLRDMYQS